MKYLQAAAGGQGPWALFFNDINVRKKESDRE